MVICIVTIVYSYLCYDYYSVVTNAMVIIVIAFIAMSVIVFKAELKQMRGIQLKPVPFEAGVPFLWGSWAWDQRAAGQRFLRLGGFEVGILIGSRAGYRRQREGQDDMGKVEGRVSQAKMPL